MRIGDFQKMKPNQVMDVIVQGAKKRTYQWLALDRDAPKRIVFIFGCQRSGTTMLVHCFRRDQRSSLYGEGGLANKSLRLRPYSEIEQIIARDKATLIVAKPIVESQHAVKLLDYFDQARAIWMYRDYRDVADSSLRKFGTESTFRNLQPIVERARGSHPAREGRPDDGYSWASENVSEHTQEIVARYFSEDMPIYDAKALFWYVRNILFFEQKLDQDPRTTLCRYKDIVSRPQQVMQNVYRFLQVDYPGDHITVDIHQRSVGVGNKAEIGEDIRHLCDDLMSKLDETLAAQSNN